MRILLQDEKPKDVRRKRSRRRRMRVALASLVAIFVCSGFYLFPGSRQPSDLYDSVDGLVRQSLTDSRADFPLRRIDVGGAIWSYRTTGTGPEAILFLHGMGGSSDIWWQQMRALSPRYSVLALQYGRVQTLDEAVAGVRATLDAEGIERAHIVGTSLGGYVAQYFLIRHPERIASVVLANTFPSGRWIRSKTAILGRLAPIVPTWILRASFRSSIREEVYPASGASALVRDYLLEQSYSMSRADYLTRIRLLRGSFDNPDIESLRLPSLIIEADNDPLVPREAREALKATYPATRVVTLSGVGHFPYLNRPALYTQTLEDFFGSFRPREGPALPVDSLNVSDSLISRPALASGSVSNGT